MLEIDPLRSDSFVRKSEEIAYNTVQVGMGSAFARVEQERHGDGCGCRSCMFSTVREINSWVDFVCTDEWHARSHRYTVENIGNGLEILPPRPDEDYISERLFQTKFER